MPRKPKAADTDYRQWTFKHFEDKYNQIIKDIEKEQMDFVSDNKHPIIYIELGNVLTRLLGKNSLSWRTDILNDDKCKQKHEKYQLLEGHDARQLNKLITYSLNDRQHQFGASKVLGMVAQARYGKQDLSLNNKEQAADRIDLSITATGKLK